VKTVTRGFGVELHVPGHERLLFFSSKTNCLRLIDICERHGGMGRREPERRI
jgi:hypothetical protein